MSNIEKNLKDALHLIGNGVFVIAAEHQGQIRGFTATWVSQASYEHALVMASASKEHDTYPLIVGSGRFVVNVLGSSQRDLAIHFGRKEAEITRLESPYFREKAGGSEPILKDAVAYLICNTVSSLDAMDHTIFLGQVVDAVVQRDEPPLFFYPRKGYGSLC